MSEAVLDNGWGHPDGSKKWHFFSGGRSLCGKWGWAMWARSPLSADDGESCESDCIECRRRVAGFIARLAR